MLVYESMLASVITARDKWLKPVSIGHLLIQCPVIILFFKTVVCRFSQFF